MDSVFGEEKKNGRRKWERAGKKNGAERAEESKVAWQGGKNNVAVGKLWDKVAGITSGTDAYRRRTRVTRVTRGEITRVKGNEFGTLTTPLLPTEKREFEEKGNTGKRRGESEKAWKNLPSTRALRFRRGTVSRSCFPFDAGSPRRELEEAHEKGKLVESLGKKDVRSRGDIGRDSTR